MGILSDELRAMQEADGFALTPQARGFRFEKWLLRLLERDDLQPRASYRPVGEQIDGSFVLDGMTYLLEAKWTSRELPASDMFGFKGKVDGKLVGTIGVYVSMAGFKQDAIDALRVGKELNVLLVDKGDIAVAAERAGGAAEMIRYKRRIAAEEGELFASFHTSTLSLTFPPRTVSTTDAIGGNAAGRHTAIIVEGRADQIILADLIGRTLQARGVERTIDIHVAHGISGVPSLIAALTMRYPHGRVAAVVDGDNATAKERRRQILSDDRAAGFDAPVFVVTPDVSAWLGPVPASLERRPPRTRARILAPKVDLDALAARDPQFGALQRYILEEPPAPAGPDKL